MDLLKSNHTVSFDKADKAPLKQVTNQTPQYATDGDPAQAIPATIFPAYHYNSLISEIVNAIKAGGEKPSNDDWGQLASIITDFIRQIGDLNGHFKNIKEVGKDAKGVYVIYEENGQVQKTYILTPSDLDGIKQRLSAAEGTIVNHSSRLDNYGDAINRIFSNELPAKANLNGNSNQDFNTKTLGASDVVTGGLGLGGVNGVGTSNALWGFSPQLLNIGDKLYRRGLLNLVYAGADDSDAQPAASRQVIQISVDRSQYTTGNIANIANKNIVNSRAIALFSSLDIYGKSTFHDGTSGVNGDLSENYKSDREDYKPGQIMMRAVNKGNEVELCTNPKRVFGVISTNPLLTMNVKDKNNPDYQRYVRIVLFGRVPVWVQGPLTIDDHITATDHGTAVASQDPSDIWIGWPIEPDSREGLRLVECFVKAVI